MEIWAGKIDGIDLRLWRSARVRGAFTLIELLVVVAIISLLVGILIPTLGAAKQKVAKLQGIVNQRSIATSLSLFANDYRDWYPHSIASVGADPVDGDESDESEWSWRDPRMMTGYDGSSYPRTSKGGYRSMSAYLSDYIDDPEILHCPSVPNDYKYIQESWDAADKWDNPDRIGAFDPMTGSYCFWWNYRGWLPEQRKVFNGPKRSSGGNGQSKMLISDYFGSDTWRNPGQYGSCEIIKGSRVIGSNSLFTDFYSGGNILDNPPEVKLTAGFTDGHVESYTSSDVVTLEVSNEWNGKGSPLPELRNGKLYLPRSSMP